MKHKQAKSFAPFPLQELHHYYGLVCHRYFIQSLYDCFPLRLTVHYRLLLFRTNPVLPSCQLNPGCHVNSNQVSFTLITDTNVPTRFRHLLLLLRDFIVGLIYSARQYAPTGIKSLFFLIVHHRGSFRPTQHKVVCKLLLKVVCGRPIPLLMLMIPRLSSLGFGFRFITAKGLPSFVQHSFRFHGLIQDTHVMQLPEGRDFNHKTSHEELHIKYTLPCQQRFKTLIVG